MVAPDLLVQQVVNGVSIGAVYALIAIGLTLVFGIMDIINFAHGEFVMLGSYALFFLLALPGMPYVVAMLVAVALISVFAVVVERSVFRPLYDRGGLAPMMASFGLLLLVQNAVLIAWGGTPKVVSDPFNNAVVRVATVQISHIRLFALVLTVVMFVGLWALLLRTKIGTAIRATAQNEEAAFIRGIDTTRVNTATFVLSGVFGAAGGVVYGTMFPIYPTMGLFPMLKAFAAIIIGGLGSVTGALVGGLLIGVVETVTPTLLDSTGAISNASQWRDAFAFLLLIGVLLLNPNGLLGGWQR
jgi:branched-chain amino acid transport system permease protein